MPAWPHSGFHLHTAVFVPDDDHAFATRLARYCARNRVALERLTNDRTVKSVAYRSAKSEGPTAGTESVDPLEFLAFIWPPMSLTVRQSPDGGRCSGGRIWVP